MSTKTSGKEVVSGREIMVPLNKLKKSPNNARKKPHGEAAITALAGSIAAKSMLQNLVVEPETDAGGVKTGFFLVTVGEGRRLAQLLRAKRNEIRKSEPIRCVLDITNDPKEISLDENFTRTDMHPADQFDVFTYLADEKGYGAEEIAARFGVSAHVVRQRLRLGAASPNLMQIYRDEGLTLEQLMAFAITDNHERQEAAFERLGSNCEPYAIRRLLTEANVAARDRRARFVGLEAYEAAGGAILRDLFSEDQGGYLEDVALLDRLTNEKLHGIATALVESEGWKWAQVSLDYPHAHGMRRTYPDTVDLRAEDEVAYRVAQAAFTALSEQYESAEELPDDVDERFGELEAEIERLEAKRLAYDPRVIARSGVLVVLNHDGSPRVERGFVRPEDELPRDASDDGGPNGEADASCGDHDGVRDDEDNETVTGKTLSDTLIRDLTAHRTLALRLVLGEQPEIALIATIHTMVAQTFFRQEISCLDLRSASAALVSHAGGIEDTAAAKALANRHEQWAVQLPKSPTDLWQFIVALDTDSRMALFAHCVALTAFAVKLPWEKKPGVWATADKLATALDLDMAAHWSPTVTSYFGRVTKESILSAVREASGVEAAELLAGAKKDVMAATAEQLVSGTGWLPSILHTVTDDTAPNAGPDQCDVSLAPDSRRLATAE